MTRPLAAVLADTAARRPDHQALVWDDTVVTYERLWDRARHYAGVLRRHGVAPGDRVVLLVPNSPSFPAVYYGVLALGAVVVPMNAQSRAAEVEFVLRDCDARALICEGTALEQGAPAAAAAGIELFTVADGHAGGIDLVAPHAGPPIEDYAEVAPDDLAAILYTSGTTGRPKGAMLTHRNIVTNIEVTAVSPFGIQDDDVLYGCLPLSHTFGQVCVMGTCFLAGATLVLAPRFAAEQALKAMERHGCTVFMGVPTMYHALLEAVAAGAPAPRLRRAYSGGSALAVPVLAQVQRAFGCEVYEGYGLTETSPCVAYNQPGTAPRPGTVGLPVEGVEVAIARADLEGSVELLPVGEVGEVVVRGHNVMAGYLGLPKATAEVLVDGWFRSGDLGHLAPDGYLTLVDRKKDVIIQGGYNVYPREVEDVLLRHPAVEQVAVVGVPDPARGEQVCAVVVRRDGAGPDAELSGELDELARQELSGYKRPRRVEFVERLPLGPSGKVLKRELAKLLLTSRAARSPAL
ncbi:long-chain-fatty-acid--CoA ligase [Streptomyces barringtoniae]|uniref:long-chain-fatty-acid--CoA ligase n=1 Tax=Streptomyces barringtoniae TaxID=2892029 RepID=UPI001E568239|nr:long-chain fatty acid--CoA ligase [Streptomyces barringtoniae]MCC5476509.1 long-chain fatty acid--CoA ligase [Streptomyces barringtoniae]